MKNTWVVVADEAIARILKASDKGGPLHPVEELTDSAAHAPSTAVSGDPEQHLEGEAFAKQVADHLATALQKSRFEELHIVAAPRFLGQLRKALSTQVSAVVTSETNKDLVKESNEELAKRLFPDASSSGN